MVETKKGHWETIINKEVQNRINQIDNYLKSYEKIKSNLSQVSSIANESSLNIKNSYNLANEGIVIGSNNDLMSGINDLATNVTDMYKSMIETTSLIDSETQKLLQEKEKLKTKLNEQVWVYDE